MKDSDPVSGPQSRAPRADGRRNRARILDAAFAAFAAEGLSVSVHEIARRADVGTGTVSRHFPTKESLFAAVVCHRVEQLVTRARELMSRENPATAFFSFFTVLVEEGIADHAVGDALAGVGFDIEAAAAHGDYDFGATLHELLVRAQQAGAVREDVDTADVKALVLACLARTRTATTASAKERMISIIRDGLRDTAGNQTKDRDGRDNNGR